MDSETVAQQDEAGRPGREATPWLEWLASGIGVVLAIATLGAITVDMLSDGAKLPVVTVSVEGVVETPAGFIALIRARNPAGATAAKVRIRGEIRRGDGLVETSSAEFDYVPAWSERRGGLYFKHDPRQYRLEARALGYSEP